MQTKYLLSLILCMIAFFAWIFLFQYENPRLLLFPFFFWLFLNLLCSFPAIFLSLYLETIRKEKFPDGHKFKWGYFEAIRHIFTYAFLIISVPFGSVMYIGLAKPIHPFISLIFAVIVIGLAIHVIKTCNKWSWIILSLMTGNIVLWVINGIYIKRRWIIQGCKYPMMDKETARKIIEQMQSTSSRKVIRYWFYSLENKKYGPIDELCFFEMFKKKILNADTKVWTQEIGDKWVEAKRIDGLVPQEFNPPPMSETE